ncbi:MAG TPA: choice-of-anchor Q domain-containing protein [Dokdonella sp.]|nr:choice-of-anchor Q domain-containing protein [Dokdonella sp.]
MHRSIGRALFGSMVGLFASTAAQAICHVTTIGNSANPGLDWTAPMDLQTALATPACIEVWVASGVYKPTTGTDRGISFLIRSGVAVYGGFAGTESAREQRNWVANPTILSGDIDNNDTTDANGILVNTDGIVGNNAYHVVYLSGAAAAVLASTVLDGFTITGGDAHSTAPPDGGGLYCNAFSSGRICSPTLSHLVFSGNLATRGGAVMLMADSAGTSNPAMSHIRFTGNRASSGGAMFVYGRGGESSPTLDFVTFDNNSADADAGALWVIANSTFTMRNGTFSGNTSHYNGGAVKSDGSEGYANLRFSNVTFHGNLASLGNGGAVYAYDSSSSNPGTSDLLFENVTFTANDAYYEGKVMYSIHGPGLVQAFRNVIFWDNSDDPLTPEWRLLNLSGAWTVDHSIFQTSCATCTNTVTADPMLAPLGNYGGSVQTRLPLAGSPAIDSGDNGVCADIGVNGIDARGVSRPQGPACDLGAVEFSSGDVIETPIFVDGFDPRP